jgi:diacylglycerol kinase (ATP)
LTSLIDRYVAYPGRVLVDGVVVHEGETLLANVGGCRYRGGQFQLLAHSLLDDGLLDVCVIGAEHHPADVLRSTRTAAHLNAAGVVYARGRQVRIERTDGDPMWFEHDGEVLLDWANAATLQVVPAAVPVIVGPSALPASSWLGPIGATSGSARPR